MRVLLGFTFGTIAGLIAITLIIPKQTQYVTVHHTEVIERPVRTTINLEQLKHQIDDLDKQLHNECIEVIARHTGDPKPGIIHLVERHYQGDACRAADEALAGEW